MRTESAEKYRVSIRTETAGAVTHAVIFVCYLLTYVADLQLYLANSKKSHKKAITHS